MNDVCFVLRSYEYSFELVWVYGLYKNWLNSLKTNETDMHLEWLQNILIFYDIFDTNVFSTILEYSINSHLSEIAYTKHVY